MVELKYLGATQILYNLSKYNTETFNVNVDKERFAF